MFLKVKLESCIININHILNLFNEKKYDDLKLEVDKIARGNIEGQFILYLSTIMIFGPYSERTSRYIHKCLEKCLELTGHSETEVYSILKYVSSVETILGITCGRYCTLLARDKESPFGTGSDGEELYYNKAYALAEIKRPFGERIAGEIYYKHAYSRCVFNFNIIPIDPEDW